jgi:uncharacterized protein (TIGR03435 family)
MNFVVSCFLALFCVSVSSVAQSDQSPHFEVASVKPVTRDVHGGFTQDAGRMSWVRIPLTNLISSAYNVNLDQITGPDWLDSEFYAIQAKLPDGSTRDQYPQMIANLLAERFGLVVHRVTKEIDGYELIVAPGGPKLTPSDPATTPQVPVPSGGVGRGDIQIPKTDADGFPVLSVFGPWASRIDGGMERMTFQNSTMAFLASRLRSELSRSELGQTTPVIDRTGISGRFDFHLAFPALSRRFPSELRLRTGKEFSPGDGDPSAISSAMEKQLGLKLRRVKTPLDFIVVDHVERVPSAN